MSVSVWLQYSVGVHWGKSDYPIYWLSAPAGQSGLDGTNLLSYKGGPKQPLSISFGVVFLVQGSTMDIVDHDPRSKGSYGGRDGRISRCFPTFNS